MSNKNGNNTLFSTKVVLLTIIILTLLPPVLLENSSFDSQSDFKNYSDSALNSLTTSRIDKDNYSSILRGTKHGLGNVTIDNIRFTDKVLGFTTDNLTYPNLQADQISGALNITIVDLKYVETTSIAISDNLDKEVEENPTITVKINETLNVSYNNPTYGFLIYHSRFFPTELSELYVNNGSAVINLTQGIDYTLDANKFIVFNYESYFQKGPTFNFTMDFIWKWTLSLEEWRISQIRNSSLIMQEEQQSFTTKFNYQFILIGNIYTQTLTTPPAPILFTDIAITINILDKEVLKYQELMLNG
ncbi:MAG: hypothetical protein ACW99L_05685, partial [Promethearchaeota archaeon]